MAIPKKLVTIERYISESQDAHKDATGEFSRLLRDLTLAIRIISRTVRSAGLVDILGATQHENIHGEVVQKLDEFANDTIYKAMDHGGHLCVMASEESDEIMSVPDHFPVGKYVLCFDPLDGSSNIDANITIGTIFGIYARITPHGKPGTEADCLQPGYKQVAAGYALYGSSTMLVITTGAGVQGFTLDPSVGEFLLSHENIRLPKRGKYYSVNEGNALRWDEGIRKYVEYLKQKDETTGRPYSGRYVGSLVADAHRTLVYGGVFLYPPDVRKPNGKLRLIYECNPLAMIIEQAGGRATNGRERILDILPRSLHQRSPLFIGSEQDVMEAEAFYQGKR
ncbi:MAG TPA: class 1 fructose-bisphosphatase [Candidatus Kapabacteria bacterium]|nr:class 1 fructose-bisphosphatase [Candidatus Kapabacteria bacterium]